MVEGHKEANFETQQGKTEWKLHFPLAASWELPVCLWCSTPRLVYMHAHKEPLWSAIKAPLQGCSRRAPLTASGFMCAGAKEDGRNSGKCAAEAWEQSVRPANDCGQADKGRRESCSFYISSSLWKTTESTCPSSFTWTCWGKPPMHLAQEGLCFSLVFFSKTVSGSVFHNSASVTFNWAH